MTFLNFFQNIHNHMELLKKTQLLFSLIIFVVVQGEVAYKRKLELEPGQDAIFNLTTLDGNPILATEFGLKGEGEILKRKFIVVTVFHGIKCGEDFNFSEGWRYKGRIYFIGNITSGHAWFKITNVDENDTNIYQVGIREKTGRPKYQMYTVELAVKRKNEASSPRTPFVDIKQMKNDSSESNNPTVNRDPPYHLLILANVISFTYAIYTLSVKFLFRTLASYQSNDYNDGLLRISGIPKFIKTPPPSSYAIQGQTAKLVWEYQVDNRNNEFEVNSPRWDYYVGDGTVLPIASEDSNYGWQWALHKDTCPKRLVDRVSKESIATLVIANVTVNDSGVYGCSLVLKMYSAVTNKVNLTVTTIPYFTTKPPFVKIVNESGDLKMRCSARGSPNPHVSWIRKFGNKTVVKSIGVGLASLRIPNITRNYSGMIYKCQANNNPSERPVEVSTQIIVLFSSKFSYLPPKNNFVIEGMYLELNCYADSLSSNVSWFHLHHGSKVLRSHGTGRATLRFRRTSRENNGTYECRATSNIIGDTGISAFTDVIVMCDCIATANESKSNHPTKEMTDTTRTTQNASKVHVQETVMEGILNSKTFMIALLTVTCISVLINILLIIYICLKIHRNRYKVSENGKETLRFGPPSLNKGACIQGPSETSPNRSIRSGSVETIPVKPVNAIYERIPDALESPSPKESHPYASPSENKFDQSPKGGNPKETNASPQVSRLQHHYQDLDDFTLVLNQREYHSLDRSEGAANPHPKHAPVGTPWEYEMVTFNKKGEPSEYQKLHVYANVKDVRKEDDKKSKNSN